MKRIQAFEKSALNEIWDCLDGGQLPPDIEIKIGSARITLPTHADSFQQLIEYLEGIEND